VTKVTVPVDIAAERELDRARSLRSIQTYGCAGQAQSAVLPSTVSDL